MTSYICEGACDWSCLLGCLRLQIFVRVFGTADIFVRVPVTAVVCGGACDCRTLLVRIPVSAVVCEGACDCSCL